MEENKNIILVGLMGSGKTTIGRQLSSSLEKKFIDTDLFIESRTGVNISTIFELEGEEGFRLRETNLLNDLLKQSDLIIATGGGIVLKDENRKILKKLGMVIYLRAHINDLVKRLKSDKNRPLIQNVDLTNKLETLYTQRDALYESVADCIIDTRSKKIKEIQNEIMEIISSSGNN